MPSTSPHMVENGSEPSITASFTYYTDATRRDALLHRSHALMRKLKVTPPAVKPASLFDTTIHAIAARLSRAPEPLEFAEVLASCARSGKTCRAFVQRASDDSPGPETAL